MVGRAGLIPKWVQVQTLEKQVLSIFMGNVFEKMCFHVRESHPPHQKQCLFRSYFYKLSLI